MKHGAPWYPRDPLAFLGGVQGLPARLHAVYGVVLDLIYAHGGEINNDPSWIAGWISDMGAAAVRNAISELVEMGKLEVSGKFLTQKIAKNVAKTREKLSENRAEIGKKGGVSSGKSRTKSIKNNDLSEAKASQEDEAIRIDKTREVVSANAATTGAQSQEAEGWTPDTLHREVLAAVGIRDLWPTHWLPPAAPIHVWRWHTELGLGCDQIVAAAKTSRNQHPEPPRGPKALDGVMRRLVEASTAQIGTSTLPASENKRDRWKKLAAG